ncbi:MAG: exodeoxyribonuclease VII small subunit [Chlamydiia bacterium]|nr:exodeoxyribonuclease VII small subunit [Chlamydiia bacterium]MCP5508834.1 exodeoxyribonuclease VII small subunit [Chlamydiales bacterium]HPE85337.1 exodeoxyribonuclease VII small subunit [Chlamydiales bacterium]
MNKELTFEQAYARLEQILSQLNSGEVSLEDSLKHYEEADKLIQKCNSLLVNAEQKVQALIKNREGTAQLNAEGLPQLEPFG